MTEWPDTLLLRDTELYDDLGGGGQRIYTTAGRGYVKTKYVRADLSSETIDGLTVERERLSSLLRMCEASQSALLAKLKKVQRVSANRLRTVRKQRRLIGELEGEISVLRDRVYDLEYQAKERT